MNTRRLFEFRRFLLSTDPSCRRALRCPVGVLRWGFLHRRPTRLIRWFPYRRFVRWRRFCRRFSRLLDRRLPGSVGRFFHRGIRLCGAPRQRNRQRPAAGKSLIVGHEGSFRRSVDKAAQTSCRHVRPSLQQSYPINFTIPFIIRNTACDGG